MGKSNTELLKIAQKYLGQGGSRFRKFCGLPAGAAWCNAFVDYIAHEGGDSSLYFDGKKPTYCPQSIKWCQQYLAQIPIYLALPMDIIYFDWEPNNIPNHIGFVRERKSDQEVYTIEGNTSGGIVAQKLRPVKYVCGVFRPHFKPSGIDTSKPLVIDSYFGYHSIACLQKALGIKADGILGKGTIKALQKRVLATQDGSWGPATSKAVQSKLCGFKGKDVDGAFGPKSVRALQEWINKQNAKRTVQDKVIAYAKKLVDDDFKYVKYNSKDLHPKNGGNCIRFVGLCLKHGGIGVSSSAEGILNNAFAEKMLKAGKAEALKLWTQRNGGKWEIIFSKSGIPESKLKPADVLIGFSDNVYKHTALKGEDGYIYDCTSNAGASRRKYSHLGSTIKLAFRYVGK